MLVDFPGRATGATRPPRGRRPRGLARSISPRTGPGAGTSSARGHAGGRRGTPGKRCSSGQLSELVAVLLWLWLPNHSSHRPQTLGPLQEVPIWDSRPATAARAPLDGAQPAPPRGGPVERKIGARPPIATSSVPPTRPPAAVAAFLPRERMCAPDPRCHISRAAPRGADLHRIRCGRVCEPPMKIFVGRAVLTSPPSIPRARAMPPAVASGQSAVPAARDSRSVASVRVAAHEVARPRRSSCGRRGGRAAPLTLCDHPDCPLHV